MTATIADPESSGAGEVPGGDGNCECGDGKYTLKIKPLKVRYDSMPRRQIKVYIKYTATMAEFHNVKLENQNIRSRGHGH